MPFSSSRVQGPLSSFRLGCDSVQDQLSRFFVLNLTGPHTSLQSLNGQVSENPGRTQKSGGAEFGV